MDSVVECLSGVVGLVALATEADLSAGQPVALGLAMPAVARYGARSVSQGSVSMVQVAVEQSGVSASSEHLAM